MLPADLAGVVVLASVAAVDPRGWYPFVVAKFAAVSVAVAVAWWAAKADCWSALDRRLVALFAGLVGVLAVAAVFGRDPLYAWIGTPERHLGVVAWVIGFAALTVGSRLADPERLMRFTRWVVVSGLVLGVYAYVERWHPLIETSSDTVRLGGLYGSASFLGAALCLVVPVCLVSCVVSQGHWWRLVAAVATALGIAALIGTGTRAAWVGLGIAGFVALVAMVSRRSETSAGSSRWRQGLFPASAVSIGFLLAIPTNRAVATRSQGVGSRVADWQVGLGIVADHPWLGVGPEGYRTVLADGVTATYERTYGRTPLPDRAHNVLIDVAAAGGVAAAALFVVIAVLVAMAGWRALRAGSGLQVGMAVAAIAYLVQQWFLFPVASIDPIFWLFAGILVASPSPPVSGDRSRRLALVAAPVVAVFVVSGVFGIAADRAAWQAADSTNLGAARRAVELRPDVARYWLLSANLQPDSIAGYTAAIADIERAVRLSPHDPIVALALADEMLRKAIATGDPGDVSEAVETWQILVAQDRNCYECHLGAGYASALASDLEAAIVAFERAAVLEPIGVTEARDRADELNKSAITSGTDSDG